jgi:hypothetical protein
MMARRFGVGLTRDGALRSRPAGPRSDLDDRHLHAPRLGLLVDDHLQLLVDLFARGQDLVSSA